MNQLQMLFSKNEELFSGATGFPLYQLKTASRLKNCRTAALGGHAQYCEDGHLNGVWYNSCRNRFCPQCNHFNREKWLKNTARITLDCPHHHIIFTIPSELNTLWRFNREIMSDTLFQTVRETLKTFSDDPRHLGAMPGMLSTLHTWGRDMSLHPHIHVLISHGGINRNGEWITPKRKALFPQKPVMLVFRGKLLSRLEQLLKEQRLQIPPDYRNNQALNVLKGISRKQWTVHFCKRYDYAQGVVKYLARYLKGSPFQPQQIQPQADGRIRFQYQSHKSQRREFLQMDSRAFIQRVLQHAPLPGKPSLRYGGLYVSSMRRII